MSDKWILKHITQEEIERLMALDPNAEINTIEELHEHLQGDIFRLLRDAPDKIIGPAFLREVQKVGH